MIRADWRCDDDCSGTIDVPANAVKRAPKSKDWQALWRAEYHAFPLECPWAWKHDPFVLEVVRVHDSPQLWPYTLGADPPAVLVEGLELYDAVAHQAESWTLARERERMEAERKRLEAQNRVRA